MKLLLIKKDTAFYFSETIRTLQMTFYKYIQLFFNMGDCFCFFLSALILFECVF